jgi:pectate lyase
VFNKEQLLAAVCARPGNEPKIIRIVGHIDFRWRDGNTVFEEYTGFLDQKNGGSFSIPSNTTLVGINDSNGRPARITGTQILIGIERRRAAGGRPGRTTSRPGWRPARTRSLPDLDAQHHPAQPGSSTRPGTSTPRTAGNAYMDGVTITRGQQIWVDHVSISDGDTPDSLASDTRHDGALDIMRGSDYVTVSSSIFTKHHKTHAGGQWRLGPRLERRRPPARDLHRQLVGQHPYSRLPLARFGQLHLYNNLVSGSTTTDDVDKKFASGLDARYQSDVINENNFYEFTGLKPKEVCGKLAGGKDAISMRSSGHRFISDKDVSR